MNPIGYIKTMVCHRFEAPRQPVYAEIGAELEFIDDPRFNVAIADLVGFERIWLIFQFHLNTNENWKPKVRPPLFPGNGRCGVFATRSPHRPNPIGLSCVRLLEILPGRLRIGECDLLNGTPVFDIKPYIPEIDAFPDAVAGWRDQVKNEIWEVEFTSRCVEQCQWILANGGPDLQNFGRIQLGLCPFDRRRKRIKKIDNGLWRLGCRVWQLEFYVSESAKRHKIFVCGVYSNYSEKDFAPNAIDQYGDLELHRRFCQNWQNR